MENRWKKKFGLEEMIVHVPLCSHKDIKRILVVGEASDLLKNELNKHECKDITFADKLNVEGIFAEESKAFDIIIYNKPTPNKKELANIDRILEPKNGIFVSIGTFIYKDIQKAKNEIQTIAKDFWICMPYSFHHYTIIFASKKYHPQAEIVLQVSDLLNDCEYYSTEMQNAAFVHPTYITKAITGIAKR